MILVFCLCEGKEKFTGQEFVMQILVEERIGVPLFLT